MIFNLIFQRAAECIQEDLKLIGEWIETNRFDSIDYKRDANIIDAIKRIDNAINILMAFDLEKSEIIKNIINQFKKDYNYESEIK